MDSSIGISILIIVFCVGMSAYFSATETAFSSMNRIRLKNMANNGNKKAVLTLKISEDYNKLLSTILIGNNIVNIASASLATVIFTHYLPAQGVTISTIVMTITILIFGEITPKGLAKETPEKVAMFSTPFIRALILLLTPLNFIFAMWKQLVSKVVKVQEDRGMTEEELLTIVEEAQSEGGIDAHEGELIRSAIEFNDLSVSDILTPRVDVVAVEENTSMEEIGEVFRGYGFSRLPVYSNTIDNIIGVIHEKDYYARLYRGEENIKKDLNNAVCTTINTKISSLLRELQCSKSHIAVVIDEFGGTAGIVTLEDILEELVGEIWDEHDDIIEDFKQLEDGSYLVNCSMKLEDFFQLLSISAECDAATVSGWVIQELGSIPDVGNQFVYGNLMITVTQVDFRRVQEIKVQNREEEQEEI